MRENQRLISGLETQHAGQSFGAATPKEITPEFVRSEVARGPAHNPAHNKHPATHPKQLPLVGGDSRHRADLE